MSDHPGEAAHHLKRINICNDVWYNIFDFFERAEIGLKLAPLCAHFEGLADAHLGIRRWSLGYIIFCREMVGTRAKLFKLGHQENDGFLLTESALLKVPPPPNLVGFNRIQIRYCDIKVIEFMCRIRHILNTVDITLALLFRSKTNDCCLFTICLWPIIAPKLYQLNYFSNLKFDILRKVVSPTVLRDCANLRVIKSRNTFPETPADDGADASVGQALAKWLHTPRTDGRPKVLHCHCPSKINVTTKLDELKRAFLKAESPVSCYIICLAVCDHFDGVPFECDNERSRERLKFQKTAGEFRHFHYWLLKRGPIWWGESEWTESEQKAKAFWLYSNEMNVISIEDGNFFYVSI